MMNPETKKLATQIRLEAIKIVFNARASHIGGALSMADILAVLYNDILNIDPKYPNNPERDRFLLSKGHCCTSLYAVLALKGFIKMKDLEEYAKDGSQLLSHTSHLIPGVEISAGSLGHALPICCGLAIAAKKKLKSWKTYCLISDGELDEGSNWESILFAPQFELDNLTLIIDYNKIQSLGFVKDIIDLSSLSAKLNAFNWETYEIDGHNHTNLYDVFRKTRVSNGRPKAVIAHTIKGKGISFMENKLLWHYKSPSKEEYEKAIIELMRDEDSLY